MGGNSAFISNGTGVDPNIFWERRNAAKLGELAEVAHRKQQQGTYEHAKAMDILDRDRSYELFNKMFGAVAPGGTMYGGSGSASDGGVSENLGVEGRLRALLDDPNAIQQTGSYKFRVGQGQEALQRSLGARGLLGSGNRLTELTKYGQDMASQEYENQFKRLSDLIGREYDYKGNMFGSLANVLGGGALGRGGTDSIWNAYSTGPNTGYRAMQGQTGAASTAASASRENAKLQAGTQKYQADKNLIGQIAHANAIARK